MTYQVVDKYVVLITDCSISGPPTPLNPLTLRVSDQWDTDNGQPPMLFDTDTDANAKLESFLAATITHSNKQNCGPYVFGWVQPIRMIVPA